MGYRTAFSKIATYIAVATVQPTLDVMEGQQEVRCTIDA